MTKSHRLIAPRQPSRPKTCATCGRSFMVKPSVYDRTKFCSMSCKRRSFERPCALCGTPFRLKPAETERRVYCSHECRARAQSAAARGTVPSVLPPEPNFTCIVCGARDYLPPSIAAKRKYCSRACQANHYSVIRCGAGGTNWKGGLTHLARYIRTSRTMRNWVASILAAHDGQCAECGDEAAHVHHVKSVAEILAELFDPTNGIALCADCHAQKPDHNQNLVRRPPRA